MNQAKRVIYNFEFKRTWDREHGYVQRCDERATEQYAGLLQIIRGIVTSKGMESTSGQFHCWDEIHESGSVERSDGDDWDSKAEVGWNAEKIHEGAVG